MWFPERPYLDLRKRKHPTMILKPQDQNRNTELVEIDSVKIRRAKNGVHIDYVVMDRGQTFEVVKHDPELAK